MRHSDDATDRPTPWCTGRTMVWFEWFFGIFANALIEVAHSR